MWGAIIGDIVGSRFEFDQGDKSREFELFGKGCYFIEIILHYRVLDETRYYHHTPSMLPGHDLHN